jgi:hypothetical protein
MQTKPVTEGQLQRRTARYFRNLGQRSRVALCQLPLTLIVAVLAVATPVAWPSLMHSPLFVAGVLLHIVLFVTCFLAPWERAGHSAFLIVPVLDLVAIGLLRNGAAPLLPGLAVLAVFPVIWLSASGLLARTSIILSIIGPLLVMIPSVFGRFPNLTPSDITTTLLFPLMMLSVSLAIHFASVHVRIQQRELKEKDKELRELLAASRDRERLLQTILDATDVGIVAVDSTGGNLLTNNRQKDFDRRAGLSSYGAAAEEHQLIFGQDKVTPLPANKRPVRRQSKVNPSPITLCGSETGQTSARFPQQPVR